MGEPNLVRGVRTELGRQLGGAHEVGEQHRGRHRGRQPTHPSAQEEPAQVVRPDRAYDARLTGSLDDVHSLVELTGEGTSHERRVAPDRLHPVQHQLRDRGAARRAGASSASAATRPIPASQGYTCEKALRLDHYQNDARPADRRRCGAAPTARSRRSTGTRRSPRSPARLVAIRDDARRRRRSSTTAAAGRGTTSAARYGRATRAALGHRRTRSNALAQEKTGEFWVDGQLFGRPRCHTTGDFEHAEVAVFVGKNPWQSHGFPRARTILKAIANDPARALIVIDPRRTETADLADIHLQVRPGTDAFCLARAAGRARRGGPGRPRVRATTHTERRDELLLEALRSRRHRRVLRAGRRRRGRRPRRGAPHRPRPASVSIFEDLGIQQAPAQHAQLVPREAPLPAHGQLRRGRAAMNIHTTFASLGRRRRRAAATADARPVDRAPHHHRPRPGNVDPRRDPHRSSRPLPGDDRRERATRCTRSPTATACARRSTRSTSSSCIDVAMTETGPPRRLRAAGRVAVREVGGHVLHPRVPATTSSTCARPLLDPLPGTLPEPEIHRRLVRALGALTDDDLAPLHAAAAQGRAAFADAFLSAIDGRSPSSAGSRRSCSTRRSGPTLPEGGRRGRGGVGPRADRARWPIPSRCSGPASRRGPRVGDALFDAILASPSGVVFTVDEYDETWRRLDTADGRIHLVIPELLDELRASPPTTRGAGDRRVPVRALGRRAPLVHRQHDLPRPGLAEEGRDGALRMHPDDAARLGIADGGRARVTTEAGAASRPSVELTDTPAARARLAAQRPRPRLSRRRRDAVVHGVAAERAHRRQRGPRLARRHALAQARAAPASRSVGVGDAPHPLRRLAVPDRPHHRPHRRLVDAARHARGVLRAPPLRRVPGAPSASRGPCSPSGSTAWSTRACSTQGRVRGAPAPRTSTG